jgi:hypothetical protein
LTPPQSWSADSNNHVMRIAFAFAAGRRPCSDPRNLDRSDGMGELEPGRPRWRRARPHGMILAPL